MKFLVYIFLFLFAEFSFAQDNVIQEKKKEIFTVVEYMPEFPGGSSEMMKFIQNNIVYPKNSQMKKLGGKVFLKFIVDSIGNINNVNVIKGTGIDELDNEAKRVIQMMPKWKPGSQNGRDVNVFFNIPINFYMDEPFFVFNVNSVGENYLNAKNLISNGELNQALSIYEKINGDAEVWYNMAVAYHLKKEKKESKNYFNKVIGNISDSRNVYYSQSKRFLEKYY